MNHTTKTLQEAQEIHKNLVREQDALFADYKEKRKEIALNILSVINQIDRPSYRKVGEVFGTSHSSIQTYIRDFGHLFFKGGDTTK